VTSEYTPVFVGGSPRSGTTLLHSLLCTSPHANDYVGEATYLTHLMRGFRLGISNFGHTTYFFDGRIEFRDYHRALVRSVMDDHHRHLGEPEYLVLKDPLLTPEFPVVSLLVPDARFVVSVRDPRDVIASRIKVWHRQNPDAPSEPTDRDIRRWCRLYVQSYWWITQWPEERADDLLLVSYEDLVDPEGTKAQFARLEAFGLAGLDPEKMYGDKENIWGTSPWKTDLYGKGFQSSSVGRHEGELTRRQIRITEQNTSKVYSELTERLAAG
jgi:hypothetical protein